MNFGEKNEHIISIRPYTFADRSGYQIVFTSGNSLIIRNGVDGDTPIIGSGFYVQSGVGGAAATGLGEDIMRTCCSFRAVDLMRGGMSAQEAAEAVVLTAHNTLRQCGLKPDCIALIVMDAKGNYAGASNHKGFVYAFSSANDAMDSNGNTVLNGGCVMAICTKGNPEVALDANTEEGKKLYINNGATVVAYGGLESGYSASQNVYSMSGTAGAWNALYNGKTFIAAFKAPSNISSFIVSAPSLSSGYKGVSVNGTSYCNGVWVTTGISGGTSVTLSSYTGGNGGPGGGGPGGPGGGWPGGGW